MKDKPFILYFLCGLTLLGFYTPSLARELAVQSMKLEFNNGTNVTLANIDEELHSKLTITYKGAGVLEGSWLVAEPGSTEGKPIFYTLSLARILITHNLRSVLESPNLPTTRTGKYLLQFCITDYRHIRHQTNDYTPCINDKLIVKASYQVQAAIR